MSYKPTSLVRWSWTHPPRCLSSVKAKPLCSDQLKEEHDEFAHFALSCLCGEKGWHVSGYVPEPGLVLCPLRLKCADCGRSAEIFDVERHGYDAELGNGCCSRRAEGDEIQFRCPVCDASVSEVTVIVSYQIDESDLDEKDKGRVSDLFDTFCLAVTCAHCGSERNVCGYECA